MLLILISREFEEEKYESKCEIRIESPEEKILFWHIRNKIKIPEGKTQPTIASQRLDIGRKDMKKGRSRRMDARCRHKAPIISEQTSKVSNI